eukprot:PhM_4_TR7704/c0_g1_i1/m.34212/K16675/ZDHHC9_14_18; palmitoyltransferase ZDHHC9/14/18
MLGLRTYSQIPTVGLFGRYVHFAPDWYMFFPILAAVYGPIVVFFYVIYANVTSPSWQLLAARNAIVVLSVCVLYNHFMAVFSNPGIVLPKTSLPDPENGTWCGTCELFRPPRSSHCVICDVCILGYDHHCGVLGCCVGHYNLRYFVGFVFFTASLALAVLVAIVFANFTCAVSPTAGHMFTAASLMLAVFCVYIAIGLCGVSGYYTYLICRDRTYKEEFRNKPVVVVVEDDARKKEPTIVGHVVDVLCSRRRTVDVDLIGSVPAAAPPPPTSALPQYVMPYQNV